MEPSRVESYIASCFSNNKDYEQISNIQFHVPKESIKDIKKITKERSAIVSNRDNVIGHVTTSKKARGLKKPGRPKNIF